MTEETKTEMVTEQQSAEKVEQTEQTNTEKVEISRAEFEKLQAALKEANKESASRRKRLEELEAAETKRKEAEMTEAEKAQQRANALEAELKTLKRIEMQRTAAEKVGLPATLAKRLQGDTEEELEADAKALLETLPKPTKTNLTQTNPGANGSQSETRDQKKARLMGTPGDIWGGGGILWGENPKE